MPELLHTFSALTLHFGVGLRGVPTGRLVGLSFAVVIAPPTLLRGGAQPDS